MKTALIVASIIIAFSLSSLAQDTTNTIATKTSHKIPVYLGVFGDYDYYFHSGNFLKLNGLNTCCSDISSGYGSGFNVGLFGTYPIGNQWALGLKFSYKSIKTDLKNNEYLGYVLNGQDQSVPAYLNRDLNIPLSGLGIEPNIEYKPFYFPLNISLALDLTYLFKSNYSYSENFQAPGNVSLNDPTGRFVDKSFSHSLDGLNSMIFGAALGVGYELSLSEKIKLVPEISYTYYFNNLEKNINWKTSVLSFGLAVKFGLPESNQIKRKCPDGYKLDDGGNCVPISNMFADVVASAILDNGKEVLTPLIKVEEFETTIIQQFLNYIYFDEGKGSLPSRYKLLSTVYETALFSEVKAVDPKNPLNLYYNVLNVVGKRLADNPSEKIKLVAYNFNDGSTEDKKLAQQRCNYIKDYLNSKWSAPKSNIKMEVRNLPDSIKNSTDQNLRNEYRRVEIIAAEDSPIISPVITKDTSQTITPSTVKFKLITKSDDSLKSWQFSTFQLGDIVLNVEGKGNPPEFYEWNLAAKKVKLIESLLDYQLRITDNKGIRDESRMTPSLHVEYTSLQKKQDLKQPDSLQSSVLLLEKEFLPDDFISNYKSILDSLVLDKDNSKIIIYPLDDQTPIMNNFYCTALNDYFIKDRAVNKDNIRILNSYYSKIDNTQPEERQYRNSIIIEIKSPRKY